ncbi:MAG: metal-dependent hydrolase [Chloroflexi bacterium]|nr:metal-dependent hydrolase [Chloroflexota bacterium]
MLLFGHIGLTTVVIRAGESLSSASKVANSLEASQCSWFKSAIFKIAARLEYLLNRIGKQVGAVDYRLVIFGSLLPDIIDKPLWFFSGGDILPSGYGYGHTFLFNLVLLAIGLILVRYPKSGLLIISLSSFLHLIWDEIWKVPVTLWWPLLGPFQKLQTAGWVSHVFDQLFSRPGVYVPELIGLIIVLVIVGRLVARKHFGKFTRNGAIK